MNASPARDRRDLHNTSINFDVAIDGRCGFTHVARGRVCRLPHRHPGPCELRYLAPSATPPPSQCEEHP
jgi:hypothetical protein